MTKPVKPEKLDRHSGTGTRGLPKKEGAGKYGWGTAGDESSTGALDPKDPNYEEEEAPLEVETTTEATTESGVVSEAK